MASNVKTVVVMGPGGRRQTIKVSPNTSILQLLEEASRKHGIDPNDYDLKHYNKSLDLSLSIRFANLPNNAMLELHPAQGIRQESVVTIALDWDSGPRLTENFTPSTTVWDVISKCLSSSENCPNFEDDSANQLTCIYMRRVISRDAMNLTTLRSLGLTGGKALFRLQYQQSLDSQQAHVSTPLKKPVVKPVIEPVIEDKEGSINMEDPDCSIRKQARLDTSSMENSPNYCESKLSSHYNFSENQTYFKPDVEKSSNVKIDDVSSTFGRSAENLEEEPCQPMDCDLNGKPILGTVTEVDNSSDNYENRPIEGDEEGTIKILGERSAILFNLEDIPPVSPAELPADFYDLSIHDIQFLQGDYRRVRMELENKPLELTSQKENKNLQLLNERCVIRIYFPDRLVLQGIFLCEEKVQTVMDFIRGFLEDKELNFYLYIAPPKTILLPEANLFECKLQRAANVYFGCGKNLESYLLPHIKDQVSDPRAANKAAAESRNRNKSASTICTNQDFTADVNDDTDFFHSPAASTSNINIEVSRTQVPKWFQSNTK